MKTVFFGTPDMSVPSLQALTEVSEVRGVVCQPDRPAGRGMQQRAPATKVWAIEHGIDVFQPEKVRDGALRRWLEDRDLDMAVVLAYGRILPPDVLRTPRLGCVNLHASLLPRHRGAAPIQWSILTGDLETGISLMQMDEGLDTGPVFLSRSLPIDASDDAGTLTLRLSALGAEVIRRDLLRVAAGELAAVPQVPTLSTLAPPIRHSDQVLDFRQSAAELQRRVRAMAPKPGAITEVRGRRLKVLGASLAAESTQGPPGTVTLLKRRILVATGEGALEITRLQLEGKAAQAAADVVNGRGLVEGDRLELTSVAAGAGA